jgi:hypothetical protein
MDADESSRRHNARSRQIPITGISLFIAEHKTAALQNHPELSKVQLFARLNEDWNALDDSTKEAFERRADYSRRMESRKQHKNWNNVRQPKVSAYSVFTRERHKSLKTTNPEMTVGLRAQVIATEWKTMSPSDKVPFINAAKRETRKMQSRSVEEESSDDNS